MFCVVLDRLTVVVGQASREGVETQEMPWHESEAAVVEAVGTAQARRHQRPAVGRLGHLSRTNDDYVQWYIPYKRYKMMSPNAIDRGSFKRTFLQFSSLVGALWASPWFRLAHWCKVFKITNLPYTT